MPAKAKLSVSIATDLVQDIDRAVRAKRCASRSAAIESALEAWSVRERAQQRDAAIEAYYRATTSRERAVDETWSDAAWSSFVEIAESEVPQHKRSSRPVRRRKKA